MDKATKVAAEKYPHGKFDGEVGDSLRAACAVGYMQAQKDLALTWEDVTDIHNLISEVMSLGPFPNIETFYTIVLKRFNEQRKK